MTRFATSKGSKASNERLPERATSWSEMKQQLLEKNKEIEESKKRKEVINQRNANYKAFLEKNEEDNIKNSKWADFPEVSKPVQRKKKSKIPPKDLVEKISSKHLKRVKEQDSSEGEEFTLLKNKIDDILDNQNINKAEAVIESNDQSDSDAPPEEESAKNEIVEPVIKAKTQKKKRKLLKIVVDKEESTKKSKSGQEENSSVNKKKRKAPESAESVKSKKGKLSEESILENGKDVESKIKQKKTKKGADKIKQTKIIKENLTERDLKKIEKKKQKRIKQLEKKKKVKAELKEQKEAEMKHEPDQSQVETNFSETEGKSEINVFNKTRSENEGKSQINSFNKTNINNDVSKKQFNKSNSFNKNEKKAKVKNEEKPQRRKPFLPHKMIIHDKEVQIDYVEGFPIKKEDAERLKKLRKEMISKGLPRSEINVALKLERRRAERALANLKKKACFNCRKSGHNLSECPELDNNEVAQTAGSGICFKCGSTEHTHFECKVVRGQEFKFAQCFICKEQGHISRQCPDNARGLYPKGGACHVCGDVTHLKRDCPKYQAQQQRQEDNLRIETLSDSNPDVLERDSGNTGGNLNKKPNKIIKF